MSFSRINATPYDDEAARAALDHVNEAIGAVAEEAAAIVGEGEALVKAAMDAEPKDATKLAKAGQALRTRRLANLLREMRILTLKQDAQVTVRAAAASEVERIKPALAAHEATLGETAQTLGHQEGSRLWTQLFVTDPTRRDLLRAKNTAHNSSVNLRTMTPEDFAYAAQLRAAIAAALK